MRIRIATQTSPGAVRQTNEDSVLALKQHSGQETRRVLLAVADGVGGRQAGDVASKTAIVSVKRHSSEFNPGAPEALVEMLFTEANAAILALARGRSELDGMATTLVLGVVESSRLWIGNAGDSRAYLVRNSGCLALTRDHSLAAQALGLSRTPRSVDGPAFASNVLTKCLGVEDEIAPDVHGPIALGVSDVVVLCSDGLHNLVSPTEIADQTWRRPVERSSRRLLDIAISRGAPDNVSVVLLEYLGFEASIPLVAD